MRLDLLGERARVRRRGRGPFEVVDGGGESLERVAVAAARRRGRVLDRRGEPVRLALDGVDDDAVVGLPRGELGDFFPEGLDFGRGGVSGRRPREVAKVRADLGNLRLDGPLQARDVGAAVRRGSVQLFDLE